MTRTPATIDERLLPPQTRRMIRAMGLPATLKLLEAHGGTLLDLPAGRVARKRSALAGLVGSAAAEAFYAEFDHDSSGRRISVPKLDKIVMQARNAAIREALQTASNRVVARRFGLTTRQVQNIAASQDYPVWRKATPQIELFDIANS